MAVKNKQEGAQPVVQRDAKEIATWVEAEVRKHCPSGGEFLSYTKTDVPDGKGGFLDAQKYARELAFRKIAEKLGDEALEGKIKGFLRCSPEDEGKLIEEMGWENFRKARELLSAMNDESRRFGHDVVSNAVALPSSAFESAYSDRLKHEKGEGGKA